MQTSHWGPEGCSELFRINGSWKTQGYFMNGPVHAEPLGCGEATKE